MKTKTIPFDLETAKKIQAGEIKGRIMTRDGVEIYKMCLTRSRQNKDGFIPFSCLVLEVPDTDAKEFEFKPFDRVLVTQDGWDYWITSLYRNKTPDGRHICIDNLEYDYCILYEGNEHLAYNK